MLASNLINVVSVVGLQMQPQMNQRQSSGPQTVGVDLSRAKQVDNVFKAPSQCKWTGTRNNRISGVIPPMTRFETLFNG